MKELCCVKVAQHASMSGCQYLPALSYKSVGPVFSTCPLLLVHITIITFNLLFNILQCLTQDVMYS